MTKRTTDLAIFSVAGGLLLWGSYKARKDPGPSTPGSYAVIGGMGLALLGAFRVSPRLGLGLTAGLVASGSYNRYRMNHGQTPLPLPGISFAQSPALDADTRAAVAAALDKESDPTVLHAFAARLSAAGHTDAAAVISKKAAELAPTTAVGQQLQQSALAAQAMLADLGYEVEHDGVLGPHTVQAIKKFQSLHDLDIDGLLGPATLTALRSATKH